MGAMLTLAHFRLDPHAAKYLPELENRPQAGERLLVILNAGDSARLLIHEADRGDPPLDGLVRRIEADPEIRPILASGPQGHRFRQTVGVAIRLRMEQLGWQTTRSKGVVRGAEFFKRAQRYSRNPDDAARWRDRALAGLDQVARIGTDEERRETGEALMQALRESRTAEGRPF